MAGHPNLTKYEPHWRYMVRGGNALHRAETFALLAEDAAHLGDVAVGQACAAIAGAWAQIAIACETGERD